jgi:hypothetical protein
MARVLSLLVLASVLVTGCDQGYCDATGLAIDIWGLPEVDESYSFDLEFEGRQVGLHCVPRDDRFYEGACGLASSCETATDRSLARRRLAPRLRDLSA